MINVSLIALLVFLGISCGKDDDKKTTSGARGKDDDKKTTEDDKKTTELEGKFTTPCGTDDAADVEEKTYSVSVWTFEGNTVTASDDSYSDSGCTVKLISATQKGTFALGEALTSPAGAKALDITPTETIFTIYDENYVALFNGETEGQEKICGGEWVSGQAKKLTNALCNKETDGDFRKIEDKFYGVFKLDGKNLFLGKSDDTADTDGSSATKRAKALDSRPAVKP